MGVVGNRKHQRKNMKINVVFSGGLEKAFSSMKNHTVHMDVPVPRVVDLVEELKRLCMKENVDMFLLGGKVRPGVLVLIDDCDWELMGGEDTHLRDGSVISFISTLHGG
eukprot:TRINITY_DN17062_c0_g1_i4.p2 TRINITY_DN17062_c0_g1~~TRINITY_DN17062_c0_g1_i4.p2  ORF type:complete len:109 (-),score=17.09 TRINITY_DN17062_c0_g1_i4:146-472(-)